MCTWKTKRSKNMFVLCTTHYTPPSVLHSKRQKQVLIIQYVIHFLYTIKSCSYTAAQRRLCVCGSLVMQCTGGNIHTPHIKESLIICAKSTPFFFLHPCELLSYVHITKPMSPNYKYPPSTPIFIYLLIK